MKLIKKIKLSLLVLLASATFQTNSMQAINYYWNNAKTTAHNAKIAALSRFATISTWFKNKFDYYLGSNQTLKNNVPVETSEISIKTAQNIINYFDSLKRLPESNISINFYDTILSKNESLRLLAAEKLSLAVIDHLERNGTIDQLIQELIKNNQLLTLDELSNKLSALDDLKKNKKLHEARIKMVQRFISIDSLKINNQLKTNQSIVVDKNFWDAMVSYFEQLNQNEGTISRAIDLYKNVLSEIPLYNIAAIDKMSLYFIKKIVESEIKEFNKLINLLKSNHDTYALSNLSEKLKQIKEQQLSKATEVAKEFLQSDLNPINKYIKILDSYIKSFVNQYKAPLKYEPYTLE